jgi:hypothetical protein
MSVRRVPRVVALALLALLALASPAQAYLDPGTGSMIVSAVIGAIAAMALALKMFWYTVTGRLRGLKRPPRRRSEGAAGADE